MAQPAPTPVPAPERASVAATELARLLVIIPAYNEETHVGAVIRSVREAVPHADVLVVDDGSKDATTRVARAAGATVVPLPLNLGYGAALQTGYKYAVRRGYDLIAQIDADGQHPASDLPKLVSQLEDSSCDVVIGSRFLDRDGHYTPSAARKLGMSLFARVVTASTKEHITDSTSGFQVMRLSVARFFCSDVYPADYPDADILILLHRSGYRVREVPVRMLPSPDGKTMHDGHRSLYYIYKMFLSVFVTVLRKRHH